jgi:6-pyruvoyltetrahydropterin/6-carboxytetrahydropterin synthase
MLVNQEIEFDAAHRLLDYDGKCSNIHGHRWKVVATWKGQQKKDGFVCDFKFLKQQLEAVVYELDHKLLLNSKDPLIKILRDAEVEIGIKTFIGNPTAEIIVQYFFSRLSDTEANYPLIEQIRLWETPASSVVVGFGV